MPWANGRGETLELVRHPSESTLENMEWRVSVASLTEPGEFSVFPGMHRTLMLLDESDVAISVDGQMTDLSQYEQIGFDGSSSSSLKSLSKSSRDLNLICRKGQWSGTLRTFRIEDVHMRAIEANLTALWIFVSGNCQGENGRILESLDLVISHEQPKWSGHGIGVLVQLEPSSEAFVNPPTAP